VAILVGYSCGRYNLDTFLVGDFDFDCFMGAVFESVVVDFSAFDILPSNKRALLVVDCLGLFLCQNQMGDS
jgi:hypothetical protein